MSSVRLNPVVLAELELEVGFELAFHELDASAAFTYLHHLAAGTDWVFSNSEALAVWAISALSACNPKTREQLLELFYCTVEELEVISERV